MNPGTPEDKPSHRVTRYTWGVRGNEIHAEERPQRDGSVLWRVGHDFGCWTRDRIGMVYEPSPSMAPGYRSWRTDEWLQNARWTYAEAMVEGPRALAYLSKQNRRRPT